MAHSILGDDKDRDNLFDFDVGQFLHDYPGRVVDEVTEALSLIEDQKTRLLGASRLATAPFAPAFQTLYRQAGNVLAPFVNRQQQAFIDIQNQFAEQRGLPQREYEPITGEQLAAPIAAAGSLLRGKLPTWFSPARRAVTTAPQQRGDLNYWLGRFKQEKGAVSEAKQLGLLSTQGEATESLLSAAPGTLTKEEALNFIEPIELTETVLLEGGDYGEPIHADDQTLNLPGGTNPKEILVQLPMKPMSMDEFLAAWDRPPTSSDELQVLYEEYLSDFEEGVAPGTDEAYTRGHYTKPNVLVHIRTNERIVDGKKTLHIEEIQSDWHQQGQKKGYYTGPSSEYSVSETEDGLWEIYDSGGELVEVEHTREAAEDVARQFGEGALTAAPGAGTVPDAPYKKDWHELAFKRALMEGINDPSIERLTWTTGDVQADRYNLAKYINSIEAQAVGDNFNLAVIHKDGHAQSLFQLTPDELSDHVGKEMAEKIVREKGGMYSGLDLEVGGEFHKNLYDKKITNFAKKFLKKYGVEPEKWQAPSASENPTATAKDGTSYYIGGRADGDDIWHILKEMPDDSEGKWVDDVLMETPGNMDAAREALRKYGDLDDSPYDLWYIDITPEMRQDLQQKGVPLTMNNRKPFLAYA